MGSLGGEGQSDYGGDRRNCAKISPASLASIARSGPGARTSKRKRQAHELARVPVELIGGASQRDALGAGLKHTERIGELAPRRGEIAEKQDFSRDRARPSTPYARQFLAPE